MIRLIVFFVVAVVALDTRLTPLDQIVSAALSKSCITQSFVWSDTIGIVDAGPSAISLPEMVIGEGPDHVMIVCGQRARSTLAVDTCLEWLSALCENDKRSLKRTYHLFPVANPNGREINRLIRQQSIVIPTAYQGMISSLASPHGGCLVCSDANARGTRIDQNYPFGWVNDNGDLANGEMPLSEPEARRLANRLVDISPRVLVIVEGGVPGILSPFDSDSVALQESELLAITAAEQTARHIAKGQGIAYGIAHDVRRAAQQSPVTGSLADYARKQRITQTIFTLQTYMGPPVDNACDCWSQWEPPSYEQETQRWAGILDKLLGATV